MAPSSASSASDATAIVKTNPRKAEGMFKDIVSKQPSITSDEATKEYEKALVGLGGLYRDER